MHINKLLCMLHIGNKAAKNILKALNISCLITPDRNHADHSKYLNNMNINQSEVMLAINNILENARTFQMKFIPDHNDDDEDDDLFLECTENKTPGICTYLENGNSG